MNTNIFNDLLQDAPFAALLITECGSIKAMNEFAKELFGDHDTQIMHKNIKSIIPNAGTAPLDHIEKEIKSCQSALSTPELILTRKDGQSFPAKVTIKQYELPGERSFLAFVEDLSSEKNLGEKFAKIFYKSPAAKILSEKASGKLVDVNDTFCRLTGYTKEELIGRTSVEIGFFSTEAERKKLVQAIQADGRAENIELTISTKARKTIHVLLSADIMELSGNQYLLTTCIDITKQKKYEKTLSKQADLLAEMNAADTRLWQTDELEKGIDEILSFTIKLSGTGMANMQLFEPSQNTLKWVASRGLSPEFQERFSSISLEDSSVYARAFRQGTPIGIPDVEEDDLFRPYLDLVRKEGIKGILSIPLTSSKGLPIGIISVHKKKPGPFDPVLVTMMDLYVKKVEGFIEMNNINRKLRELNESLEKKVNERTEELSRALSREKELNDLKSRFVSMASHEFRTPLSAVMSSASLIEHYKVIEDHEKLDKHISRIKSSVRHLTQILNDFLSLGKLEEGKVVVNVETFDLKDFFSELIEEVGSLLKEGQIVETTCGEEIGIIESDSRILKNILLNLISNASKYSDSGKAITIECEKIENRIVFHVRDQGIGIPDDEQKHMFDRFFRASNTGTIQGTGLGLNIVKRYVDLISGEISFTSKKGTGTSFYVSIPQHQ